MFKLIGAYKNWWRNAGKSQTGSVSIVAQRFLKAFVDHGVEVSQIPRLLPQIRIADLQSPENLLTALTPEILDQTAQLFGIRSQWLEGADDKIYEYLACYKQPDVLLEHLEKIAGGKDPGLSFPLRAFTTTKKLDCKDDNRQLLAPVIVEQIATLGDEEIYRYHIYRDEFDWGYFPARIELKAIARIVDTQLHTPVPLFEISEKEMRELLDGRLVPTHLFRGALLTEPSLEDFALTSQESAAAKETEEIPEVLKYIEEYQLQHFTFEHAEVETAPEPVVPTAEEESDTEIPPPETGKRANSNKELWEPVSAVASTLWHEFGDSLTIAEAARRIKDMTHLKASAFSIDAIRKRIAPLAPPNVRGKSGRKPKKST